MQLTAPASEVNRVSILSFFQPKYTFKDNLHELFWSQLFVTVVKHKKLQCFPSPYWKLALLCLSFFVCCLFVCLFLHTALPTPPHTERALLRKDKSTKKKDSGNSHSALYCYSEWNLWWHICPANVLMRLFWIKKLLICWRKTQVYLWVSWAGSLGFLLPLHSEGLMSWYL